MTNAKSAWGVTTQNGRRWQFNGQKPTLENIEAACEFVRKVGPNTGDGNHGEVCGVWTNDPLYSSYLEHVTYGRKPLLLVEWLDPSEVQ